MTPDQLKKIAEACRYEVVVSTVLDPRKVYIRPEQRHSSDAVHFAPHIDANQAIACLRRRFSPWRADDYGKVVTVEGNIRRRPNEGCMIGKADTFPLAACNAILESLK